MSFHRPPKFLLIDEFLPVQLLADLLDYTLKNQSSFHPTEVINDGVSQVDLEYRQSSRCKAGLGPHKAAFKAAIHARLDEFFESLGVPPFDVAKTELELAAHGDKAFYKSHIDTRTGGTGQPEPHYRVLSLVYYFHQEPKRFTGGEIALHPFGVCEPSDDRVIEPLQNRLVVFPSFTSHEVRKVSCPSDEFSASRFAINCWLRKARSEAAGSIPA